MSLLGEQYNQLLSGTADGVINANRFVKRSATIDGAFEECDTAGEGASGIAFTAAAATGDGVTVARGGVALVEAGAAVARGAQVMTNAAGKAITATATNKALGIALEAAGADGDLIHVEQHEGYKDP